MPRKQESTWESIVLAGDGSTWRAEDWDWDSVNLVAQPKRRSPRLEQTVKAQLSAPRPCAAAERLASHVLGDAGEEQQLFPSHSASVAKPLAEQRHRRAGGCEGDDSSPSSSSKSGSGRGGGGGGKAASKSRMQLAGRRSVCQADGCHRDLSTLTYYHQRNRICEVHIKADVFLRDGEELRFCQRCGHSHPLEEFDPGKHSCRKQLEKHNARRRKTQAAPKAAKAAAQPGKLERQRQQSAGSASRTAAAAVGDSSEPSPCASSSSPNKAAAGSSAQQPVWLKLEAGLGPSAAGSAGSPRGEGATPVGSRAQERLAARIAKLAAEGTDVGPLLQTQPLLQQQQHYEAGVAKKVEQEQQAEQPQLQQKAAGCCCTASVQLSKVVQQAAPALEGLEMPSLAELAGAGGDGGLQDPQLQLSESELVQLLDFDLDPDVFTELPGMPPSRDAAAAGQGEGEDEGEGEGALADDLSEWITNQLADHSMLCEALPAAPQPQPAAPAPAAQPTALALAAAAGHRAAEVDDVLMSLFDDMDLPLAPGAQQAPADGGVFPAAPALQQQPWALATGAAVGMPVRPALPQAQQPQPPTMGSFALATGLVGMAAPAAPLPPPPEARSLLTKVSVKLFGCTPEELPTDLRQQISSWFSNGLAAMDGYIRPGCVHLTIQAVLDHSQPQQGQGQAQGSSAPSGGNGAACSGAACGPCNPGSSTQADMSGSCCQRPERQPGVVDEQQPQEQQQGQQPAVGRPWQPQHPTLRGVLGSLLASRCDLWRRKTLLVQCGSELGLVHGGALRQAWDVQTAAAARAVPQVESVSPPVVLGRRPGTVKLTGVNLMQDDCELLARMHGAYLDLPSAHCTDCCCRATVAAAGGGSCSRGRVEGESAGSGWEGRCCGCCTARLQPGPAAPGEGADDSVPAGAAEVQEQLRRAEEEGRRAQAAPRTQSVRVALPQGLSPGLLYLDVQRGAFSAPQGARLLVVDSEEVQQELWSLQDRLAPEAYATLLDQFGVVLEWLGAKAGGRPDYGLVERTAASLLHWCASSGLPAMSDVLLRMLAAEAPAGLAGALARTAELACRDGLSLLHRAVQSRSTPMVEAVLSWGEEAGVPWPCDLKGPLGLTPLHLAAVLPQGSPGTALLEALLRRCKGGPSAGAVAWCGAKTTDGLTPEQFAGMAGTAGEASAGEEGRGGKEVAGGAGADEGDEPGPSLSVRPPPTPRRCRCTGDCPCARATQQCAWCQQGAGDWQDTASSGGECCATGEGCCGLDGGKCGCCGSGGAGGEGSDDEGSGGSGGGGGDRAPGRGQPGGGCCGGGGGSDGHDTSPDAGGLGEGGGSDGCGGCGGRGQAGAPGAAGVGSTPSNNAARLAALPQLRLAPCEGRAELGFGRDCSGITPCTPPHARLGEWGCPPAAHAELAWPCARAPACCLSPLLRPEAHAGLPFPELDSLAR